MSGPFVCGMRKFDKHKMMTPDRPSNNALYQENQKSLNDLIKQREQQDKGTFTPIPHSTYLSPSITSSTIPSTLSNTVVYTPWKTPSSIT
jgi:hypothetical protein